MHTTPDFNHHDTAAEVVILREQNSLLNVLSDYATALISMTTTEDVLRYTSSEVVGRMGFNDCVVYLWDNARERLIQCSAFGHKSTEHGVINNALALTLGEGIVGRAAQLQQPIIVNDLSHNVDYVFDLHQAASELAIPIIHLNELIGVIDSESKEIGFYTEDRVKLLTTVASMLSAKLAQTKLITQLETSITQLEYAEKLQKVLFRIAELTYEDDNFFKVYDKIHSLISELFYAKSFFVAVYNEESSQIEFPYFVDESLPDLAAHIGPADSKMEGLSAWVIFNNASLLLSKTDIIERAKGKEFKILGNIAESWLGVPIHAGEDLKGALVVQSYSPNISYVEKDRELLSFVSSHVCSLLKRKITEKKLQYQALHDALTGLANRTLFLDRVSHALKKNERQESSSCAILYMDVDLFKGINDRYGHGVGDALLIEFAKLLRNNARESDTVARLGGDEFAIFLEDLDHKDAVITLALRILRALELPLMANNTSILTSSSIGIAVISDEIVTATEAIRRADAAMYEAKAAGRGNYQIYDPLLDSANARDLVLGEEIQAALVNHEFHLFYQPIVSIGHNKATGFEALIRWCHPTKSWIPPNEFIDYAEKRRLIEKIDRYVLRQAMQQMQDWQKNTGFTPQVSVNISGRHFASPEFISYALELLDEFNLPPNTLGIEITERAVIDKFNVAQSNIQTLRDHHVRVLLDDFGTGYSSLNYLHQLTLDVIKIDRTFVSGIQGSKNDNPIINSIVTLAEALNLKVVAEGVETLTELNVLKEIGCELCQGYYFAKALPHDQAIAYYAAHQNS